MNKKVGNLSFKVPDENEPSFDKPYSESTAQLIDEEARKLVDDVRMHACVCVNSSPSTQHRISVACHDTHTDTQTHRHTDTHTHTHTHICFVHRRMSEQPSCLRTRRRMWRRWPSS